MQMILLKGQNSTSSWELRQGGSLECWWMGTLEPIILLVMEKDITGPNIEVLYWDTDNFDGFGQELSEVDWEAVYRIRDI